MRNVLYELYDGKLSRESLEFGKDTPYAHALNRVADAEDDLIAALNEEQKALLQLYSKAQGAFDAIVRREEFAAGFQVGARIMLAVLEKAPAAAHPDGKA